MNVVFKLSLLLFKVKVIGFLEILVQSLIIVFTVLNNEYY